MNTAPAMQAWWRPEPGPRREPVRLEERETGRMPLWALLGFTFVLLMAPQSIVPALGALRIGMLAAGTAILVHLYDRFSRGRSVVTLTRETWIAIALMGWATVTLPFSWWPSGSLSFMVDIFAKAVIVFWLVGSVVTTVSRLSITAWFLSIMAIPLALTAVKHQMDGVFMRPDAMGVKRIAGYDAPLTGNPNDLAAILNMILPLTLALALGEKRRGRRAILWGLVALDAIAVVATFSRAGFLTLGLVTLVCGWKLHRRGRLPWALAALLLIAIPLGPSGYLAHMSTITDVSSDTTGSSAERWGLLVTAVRFVAMHPVIGTGIGLNVLAMNEGFGTEVWREVHNAYLEYAVELGIPGAALFATLLLSCLSRTRRAQLMAARVPGAERLFLLAEGVQVSLIAYALSAFFHPLAYHFHFYYFAGLAVGLGAASVSVERAIAASPEARAA